MSGRLCEVCGRRSAKYVCQECGRGICELCIEPYTWFCLDCYRRFREQQAFELKTEEEAQVPLITKIFLGGFILIIIGTVTLMLITLLSRPLDSFGFVLLIPPIPIIFGAGENAPPLLALAIILAIFWIILLIIIFSKRRIEL